MIKFTLAVFLLNAAWTPSRGDAEVSCQVGHSCLLPCSFPAGDEVVIHWIQLTPTRKQAHSFYHNNNQLDQQDAQFKGRTFLFMDQISRGNASLQLSEVMVKDEGRYQCYSSIFAGNQDSFINLKAFVLVQDVNIEHSGREIICSSDGIYPKPTLIWTPDQTEPDTSFTQTEQKLYNIRSSVTSSDSREQSDVICTISTPANSRRAILKPTVHQNISGSDTSISCSTVTAFTYFIWRFNHSEDIVNGTADGPHSPTENWKQYFVEATSEKLTLKHLQPSLTGIYTCVIRSEKETFVQNSFLHITEDNSQIHIVIGVVVAVVLLIIVIVAAIVVCCKRKKKKKGGKYTSSEDSKAEEPLQTKTVT